MLSMPDVAEEIEARACAVAGTVEGRRGMEDDDHERRIASG